MNDIFGKMRKKALGRVWIGLFCLVLGIVFTVCNQNLIGYLTAKKNAFDMNTSEFKSVSQGNSTIPEVYAFEGNMFLDWYGNDDEGYYFILPTADQKFMGCFIYSGTDNFSTAMEIVEEYQKYLTGETDKVPEKFVTGKGYVYDMASNEKQYFKEYMDAFFEAAGVGNGEDYLVYKTFVLAPMGKVIDGSDYFLAILGVLCSLFGIWYVLSFFTGNYKKQPKKYIAAYGISESELASDLTYAMHEKNMDIGKKYAMCYGTTCYLIPYSQLLWTYVHITKTTHRTYGIKTGTSYAYMVYFAMRDKNKYSVAVKSESEGQGIVQAICEMAPHVIGGYHDDLDKMFSKNVNDVIRIVEEHKEELARKAAGEAEAAASEEGYTPPDSVSMKGFSIDGSGEPAGTTDGVDTAPNSGYDDGFDPAAYTGSSQGSGLDAGTFGTPGGSSSGFKLKDE